MTHFQIKQLNSLAQQYRAREVSMKEICRSITDATGHPLHPSENPSREYWKRHAIPWHRSPGPTREIILPEVESAILELAGHMLKRRLKKDATLQLLQYDWLGSIPYRDGKKIFDLKDLYMGNRKMKETPKYPCRYQAYCTNMI
jgi:hypothetical protein